MARSFPEEVTVHITGKITWPSNFGLFSVENEMPQPVVTKREREHQQKQANRVHWFVVVGHDRFVSAVGLFLWAITSSA